MDHHNPAENQKFIELFQHDLFNCIDLKRFSDITKSNIDLALSLLDLFKQQATEQIHNLETALASQKNHSEIVEAAHALKGATLCIGANQVTELSKEIESKALNEQKIDPKTYKKLFKETKTLLHYISAIELKVKSS